MKFEHDFEITLKLIVEVTHYKKGNFGCIDGKPEDCYPPEPAELEFVLYSKDEDGKLHEIHESLDFLYQGLYESVLEEVEERQ